MRTQSVLIAVLVFNSIATLAAFGYAFVDHVGWQIGFFYGNKQHIEHNRLNGIRDSVDSSFYTNLAVFGVICLAWFVLTCFLLASNRQSGVVSQSDLDPNGK